MTLVVCPNLAIDRMIAAAAIERGGLMRCRALRTQAGGKGANVLRALRALGGDGVLAGFAAGRGGRLIAELADDEGLDLELVVTGGEARVSTVVLEDGGSVTRLYELGPQITPDDERALLDLVAGRAVGARDWAVVSGAAPPGASSGFYAALVRGAREAGYRVLVDATGEQLAGALAEQPELVKVNLAEACSAVGEPFARCRDERTGAPEDLAAEGVELSRRLVAAGAVSAIVTLGAAGAVGVIAAEVWHVHTRPVAAVNPVGSGDCFAAGLIRASGRGVDTGAALRLAAGAAAANATSPYNGHVDPAFAQALTDDAHAVRRAV